MSTKSQDRPPRGRPSGLHVAERPSVRDRVAARWRSAHFDHELADGVAPEESAALALRARRLTGLGGRRSMADALRRILRDGQEPGASSLTRVAPVPERVAAAFDELTVLAETLAEPGPVAARGAAEARILLTDGTGPLYNPCSRASLEVRARRAREHLRAPDT